MVDGIARSTALGYNAKVTASDQVRIGDEFIGSIGGFQDWTNFSDGRYKQNVHEDVPGLSFITRIKPVTYSLDAEALARTSGTNPSQREKEWTQWTARAQTVRATRAKQVQTGFIAQQVEEVARKLHFPFSGVDAPKNGNDFYGLRYAAFVVPLVKAVQELDAINKDNEERISKLETENATISQELNELKVLITGKGTTFSVGSAFLKAPVPNPSRNMTTIRYHLPASAASARLTLSNAKGQVLREVGLASRERGQLNLSTAGLPSGVYSCTLWVNEKQVDSKQLVIAR